MCTWVKLGKRKGIRVRVNARKISPLAGTEAVLESPSECERPGAIQLDWLLLALAVALGEELEMFVSLVGTGDGVGWLISPALPKEGSRALLFANKALAVSIAQ